MIIVNADDFGLSENVNEAIIRSFKEGIISSTTIMANMPAFDDAVKLAYDNKINEKIGLHFNIMEGRPLTEEIMLCPRLCADGRVFTYKRNSVFKWTTKEKEAIRAEFNAQYNRVIKTGIKPTHLDSHLHVHTEIPIYLAIREDIKKLGIKRIRRSRNVGVSLKVMPYKFITNTLYKLDGLKMMRYFTVYDSIKKSYDSIELMCHPTIDLSNNQIVDAVTHKKLFKLFEDLSSYQLL